MRAPALIAIGPAVVSLTVLSPTLSAPSQGREHPVLAQERAALTRWGNGDPEGYLGNYSADVTYFDPFQPGRVDGNKEMRRLYAPIAGKVKVDSFRILNPSVQQRGDMAVLSYNLVSYGRKPDGDTITVRWNSTAVYARDRGTWSEIHSHWSFTMAGMAQPAP